MLMKQKIYNPKCWYVIDEYKDAQNVTMYNMVIGEIETDDINDITKLMPQSYYHNILIGKYNVKLFNDEILLFNEDNENISFMPNNGYCLKKTKLN